MYNKQREKISQLEDALKNCQQAQQAYADRVEDAKSHISECEKALDQLKDAAGDTSAEQEKLTAELDKWNKELTEAQAGQEAAGRGVENWQKQLNYANVELNNLSDEIDQNNRYMEEAAESADGCAKSIDEYGNEVKDAGEESQEFGDKSTEAINSLAQAMVAAGLAQKAEDVAKALYECVDTFAEFESQMSSVQAISGATASEMEVLSQKAQEMGATTSFTATQAGKALEYMAMAGWSTQQMLDGLDGVMNLAAASGEDLATVSDIVTDGLTAFGMAASESSHFADVLAEASARSNTNVSMLGESFKYVAPVAGALGMSIEDVAVALGLMANASIKGSQSGTALRTALSSLTAPTTGAEAAMKAYGITLEGADGSALSLADVMGQLREKLGDLDPTIQTAAASAMFGREAMSGMLAIINASEEDFQNLTDSINNCNGAAQRMAEIRLDNYAGQVTLLNSALDGLKMTIGSQLAPVLELVAKGATTAVGGLDMLLETCPALSAIVAGLVTTLGAFTAALAGFQVIKTVTPMIKAFNVALAANPAGAAAIAIVGVVTALGTLAAYCTDATSGVGGLNKKMREINDTYKANETQTIATAEAANTLIDRLAELEAQESMTEGEAALYAQTVDQLKTLVPDLNVELDEQTGLLVGGAEALRAQTEAWKENALAQAMQEKYQEILNGQAEALIEVAEKQVDYNDALATCTDLERQMEAVSNALNQVERDSSLTVEEKVAKIEALNGQMTLLGMQYTTAKEKLNDQTAAMEAAQKTAGAFDAELEKARKVLEALTGNLGSSGQSFKDFEGYANSFVKEMQSLEEAYMEAAKAAQESIKTQFKLWDDLSDTVDASSEALHEGLRAQTTYWSELAYNLDDLNSRNIEGLDKLVNALNDGSREGAAYIAALAASSDKEIEVMIRQYDDLTSAQDRAAGASADWATGYSRKVRDLSNDLVDAVQTMNLYGPALQAGSDTAQGYIDGLNSRQSDITQAMRKAANDGWSSFKNAIGIKSPSKAFRESGNDTIEGYELGIEDRKLKLQQKMEETALSAAQSFQKQASIPAIDPSVVIAEESRFYAQVAASNRAYEATQGGRQSATGTIINNFDVSGMVVREEADIKRIARDLYQMQARAARGRGGYL